MLRVMLVNPLNSRRLARTRMPYVCPRGRPIMVFTSNAELLRKFDR